MAIETTQDKCVPSETTLGSSEDAYKKEIVQLLTQTFSITPDFEDPRLSETPKLI